MCNPFQQISRRVSLCLCVVADNHLFTYLSICLIYLCIYLTMYLSIYLRIICSSIYPSLFVVSPCLSLSLSLSLLPTSLFLCLSLCPSVSLSLSASKFWACGNFILPLTSLCICYCISHLPCEPNIWRILKDDGIFQAHVLGGMFQPLMSATILYQMMAYFNHLC